MLTAEKHLDNLVRHIGLVREAGLLLGKRLMEQGRIEFGRLLIGRVFIHDASKFAGIEWDYLHAGNDVPLDVLNLAIQQHVKTNPHHPEYWGGFHNMPEIYIAEMACDLYARSQEFGSSLKDWLTKTGIEKYKISLSSDKYKQLMGFIDLLLENAFVPVTS